MLLFCNILTIETYLLVNISIIKKNLIEKENCKKEAQNFVLHHIYMQ